MGIFILQIGENYMLPIKQVLMMSSEKCSSVMKVSHKCKVLGADGIEITFVSIDITDIKH